MRLDHIRVVTVIGIDGQRYKFGFRFQWSTQVAIMEVCRSLVLPRATDREVMLWYWFEDHENIKDCQALKEGQLLHLRVREVIDVET